jgi:hypothetical protein
MDQMSTIVVKPECKEQKPLPGVPNVKVVLRHFHRTTTRVVHCGSLLEGLRLLYAQAG